jgi:hypothetical protein
MLVQNYNSSRTEPSFCQDVCIESSTEKLTGKFILETKSSIGEAGDFLMGEVEDGRTIRLLPLSSPKLRFGLEI